MLQPRTRAVIRPPQNKWNDVTNAQRSYHCIVTICVIDMKPDCMTRAGDDILWSPFEVCIATVCIT